MRKICITSDLHGQLPDIPECDLLLIAGDICPGMPGVLQAAWFNGPFRQWCDEQPVEKIVCTWGNHDEVGQYFPGLLDNTHPCVWLCDYSIDVLGLRIWGCPWSRTFGSWNFMKDKLPLIDIHRRIPYCDILLSHGPMHGVFDCTGGHHVGARSLNNWVHHHQPKLVVTGHIHEQENYCAYLGRTLIVNASYLDNKHRPHKKPFVMEL